MIVKHGQDNGKLAPGIIILCQCLLTALEEQMDKWMKKIQPVLYMLIGFINCLYVYGCIIANVSFARWNLN